MCGYLDCGLYFYDEWNGYSYGCFMQLKSGNRQYNKNHWAAVPKKWAVYAMDKVFPSFFCYFRVISSPEEAVCLNNKSSTDGPWFSHRWGSESFRDRDQPRIEKRSQGSSRTWGGQRAHIQGSWDGRSSVGERVDGRRGAAGALQCLVIMFSSFLSIFFPC